MHSLYCGVTQTGKTTLAREHSRELHSRGHNVIVYDPVFTPTAGGGWGCKFYTSDFDVLIEHLNYTREPWHVFIDEAGDHFTMSNRDNWALLTRGRHAGLHINLIVQRPKMLAPTVRTQCNRAYVFRMSPDDTTTVGEDFGHVQLGKTLMDKGDYLVLNSGSPSIEKFNCFS